MRGTLLRRRNTHDSRQSGLATAFCDDRQAADRNHLFVTQSGFGPGFKNLTTERPIMGRKHDGVSSNLAVPEVRFFVGESGSAVRCYLLPPARPNAAGRLSSQTLFKRVVDVPHTTL